MYLLLYPPCPKNATGPEGPVARDEHLLLAFVSVIWGCARAILTGGCLAGVAGTTGTGLTTTHHATLAHFTTSAPCPSMLHAAFPHCQHHKCRYADQNVDCPRNRMIHAAEKHLRKTDIKSRNKPEVNAAKHKECHSDFVTPAHSAAHLFIHHKSSVRS